MTKQMLEIPKSIGERFDIPLENIEPNPNNRKVESDERLKSLAQSIKETGLLHPLIVRKIPDNPDRYMIVAGEWRFRALQRLKSEYAPCVVVDGDIDPAHADVLGVVENHLRNDPTVLEEAEAVRKLLDQGLDTATIARSLGQTKSWVARRASLTELSERWLAELQEPESLGSAWPPSHLEVISRFPQPVQDQMLEEVSHQWNWSIPPLAELEKWTGRYLRLLSAAPWKADDETLVPEIGSCLSCPKRSSFHPELFDDLDTGNGKTDSSDHCLDVECWAKKARAYLYRRIDELKAKHPNLVLFDARESGAPLGSFENLPLYRPWETTDCRKNDKKAVPALVVGGPTFGRIKWVKVDNERARSTSNGTHAVENESDEESPSTPVEKTPEMKKGPYDKRRRQFVIDAVRTKLETLSRVNDLKQASELEGAEALTEKGMVAKAIFLSGILLDERGWRKDALAGSEEIPPGIQWEDFTRLQNHSIGGGDVRDALLGFARRFLRFAVQCLNDRLRVYTGQRTNDAQYEEAVTICAWLGFDLENLRGEAATQIPYAKAWKDQVEDEWILPPSPVEAVEEVDE